MSFAFLYSMSKMRKGRYIEYNFVEPFVMQSILMSIWCCCYHYEYYYYFFQMELLAFFVFDTLIQYSSGEFKVN